MNIDELVKQTIHDAKLNKSMGNPEATIIDIKEYEISNKDKYNQLTSELNKLGYKCCEIEKAPYPFNLMDLKGKLLIYK